MKILSHVLLLHLEFNPRHLLHNLVLKSLTFLCTHMSSKATNAVT